MESGYLSRDAVKDLMAVRDGELIYLRNRVKLLEQENEELLQQVAHVVTHLDSEYV